MARTDVVTPSTLERISLDGRVVEYRVIRSDNGKKLRIRVGPHGVEVVQPVTRSGDEVEAFLVGNARWIVEQVRRAERLRNVTMNALKDSGEILFRGEPTRVRVQSTTSRSSSNTVRVEDGGIVVFRSCASKMPASASLERWFRREARRTIHECLAHVGARLGQQPDRVYVMGQRTKWGNCSTRRNLSFNWRLILAPEYVLRYIVTHEVVHLAVPDHSAKFWLTVKGLCPESEKARQWLVRHQAQLQVDLSAVLA